MDRRQRLHRDRVRRHHRRMKPAAAVVFATAVLGAMAIAAEIPISDRKSGYEFMARETRAMQDDDTANPGMLWGLDREALWNRKEGAAAKSCADFHAYARVAECQEDIWGQRLAGAVIAHGHPSGSPLYRLEWQALGSLQRRLRNCLVGMPAVAYPSGAPEYVDLDLYLIWRARGMPIE